MKIAILSDIHGNLPALQIMLKNAGNVDKYICLGDVVNYGPWSNECVELIMHIDNCIILMGNHERYFLAKKYIGTNEITRAFFNFCIKDFNKYKFLSNFQEKLVFGNFLFIHTIDNRNIYSDSKVYLDRNYVIGHSHHQFKLQSNNYVLYNTGSVGQNRKYINVIDYIIYYSDKRSFEFKNITYDVDIVINEMRKRKYPQECIEYYSKKKRK